MLTMPFIVNSIPPLIQQGYGWLASAPRLPETERYLTSGDVHDDSGSASTPILERTVTEATPEQSKETNPLTKKQLAEISSAFASGDEIRCQQLIDKHSAKKIAMQKVEFADHSADGVKTKEISPFYLACRSGCISMVKALHQTGQVDLEETPELDEANKSANGRTPLLAAITHQGKGTLSQRLAVIRYLLEAGSDSQAKDVRGIGADILNLAFNKGNAQKIQRILSEHRMEKNLPHFEYSDIKTSYAGAGNPLRSYIHASQDGSFCMLAEDEKNIRLSGYGLSEEEARLVSDLGRVLSALCLEANEAKKMQQDIDIVCNSRTDKEGKTYPLELARTFNHDGKIDSATVFKKLEDYISTDLEDNGHKPEASTLKILMAVGCAGLFYSDPGYFNNETSLSSALRWTLSAGLYGLGAEATKRLDTKNVFQKIMAGAGTGIFTRAAASHILATVLQALRDNDIDKHGSGGLSGSPVSGVKTAAIEEIIFRFGLQNILDGTLHLFWGEKDDQWKAEKVSTLISASAFGLVHLVNPDPSPVQVGFAFCCGIILGEVYRKHGLSAAITAHAVVNLMNYTPDEILEAAHDAL